MTQSIRFTREAGVATIRFNRPQKKNAIDLEMYRALGDALLESEGDAAVRVMFLCGVGDDFTAGNDLADFAQRPPDSSDAPSFRFLRALASASKPLVAAVDGNAIGIGVTMLLHCDLVYASDRARLKMPFVDLGLIPEAASTLLLPRLVGPQRAAELLMLGESLSARRAEQFGLVNAVVPAPELEAHAASVCRRLAQKSPSALRHTKALLRDRSGVLERIAEEGAIFGTQLRSAEAREAISAFFEKRAPDFSKLK
jgi:enoyl-CoA hydratase/carnithine racemase